MSTAMMLMLLMFSVQGSVCALMKVPFVTSARANAPSTMSRVDSSAWPIRCTTPGSSRRCDSPMCALSRGPMFSPMFSRARAVPQTDLLPRIPGSPSRNRKPVVKTPGYLTTGPILLSWIGAIVTLILQASLTDWAQLGLDAQATFGFLSNDPTLQRVARWGHLKESQKSHLATRCDVLMHLRIRLRLERCGYATTATPEAVAARCRREDSFP